MKDRKRIALVYFVCICIIAIMASCESNLDIALKDAGKNRQELEKVLNHFKDDPNHLKYKAAKFLIENMPYHYSMYGNCMKQYSLAYEKMAHEPLEFRDSVFNKEIGKIDLSNKTQISDINTVKADFLIRAIDEACDTWSKVNWNNEYDESLFFDYVLPYRLSNEPLSDWRDFIAKEYPYLCEHIVLSKRGLQLPAALNNIESAKILDEPSALKGKSVLLSNKQSCVTFNIPSDISTQKLINFRYNTVSKVAKAIIELNGKVVGTLQLEPTNTVHAFRSSRYGLAVNLNRGNNKLKIRFVNDPFEIDYIEIASRENYEELKCEDYSGTYCQIRNKMTGNYVSMDTLQTSMLKPITLRKYSPNDKSFNLRLDYLGYPCWKISPMDSIDMCIEDRWVSLDAMAPVGKYNYLRANHQKWVIIPIGGELCKIMNKDTGLFWESSKDKETGNEIIVQNVYSGKASQKWIISKKNENPYAVPFFKIGSALSEALRVNDVMSQFEFIGNNGDVPPSLASLCKYRTGTCRDEASFVVAMSRSLGIPTAIDFTPHWGNRTNSHSWSVLILPNGKATPFYMGCVPGDTSQYYHSYLKPKIFRHRFQLNCKMVDDFKDEEEMPELFHNPDFIDVTDEYYQTTDVTREIPKEYREHKVAYICVFDKENWVPVYYGKISFGKARFNSMGRNILYSVGFYENGSIQPVGNPFIITGNGDIREVPCNSKRKQSMTLLRKYPYFGKEDYFNFRMNVGKFQGANKPDFSDAYTFFSHEGITKGCWYERKLKKSNATYKYLRYLGPVNSYCNINELEFYDDNKYKLTGKIIGTQGLEGQTKETVFDGDVLTGFNGNSPDGHWVGIKLDEPARITKVRYMPRNDGNCVEVGDVYQLKIYNQGDWKTLAWKRARTTQLTFSNIPSEGLFILKDKTKGVEERIFTYEKGKQMWW